ncbi:MAG: hypothetical protein WBN90_00090 [Gammaproteobacteria bacterium]
MLQLRCTAKVRKELGIKPTELAEVKPGDSLLGNWYVNIFTVDRRKTFIFMNEKTLLSFIIFGIKKSNVKKTPGIFLRGIDQLLVIEGFDTGKIDTVFKGYEAFQFTKTASKSILGNMNDLVHLYKHSIYYDGGFKHVDIGELILRINRTPQRNLGWSSSIETVRELLTAKGV